MPKRDASQLNNPNAGNETKKIKSDDENQGSTFDFSGDTYDQNLFSPNDDNQNLFSLNDDNFGDTFFSFNDFDDSSTLDSLNFSEKMNSSQSIPPEKLQPVSSNSNVISNPEVIPNSANAVPNMPTIDLDSIPEVQKLISESKKMVNIINGQTFQYNKLKLDYDQVVKENNELRKKLTQESKVNKLLVEHCEKLSEGTRQYSRTTRSEKQSSVAQGNTIPNSLNVNSTNLHVPVNANYTIPNSLNVNSTNLYVPVNANYNRSVPMNSINNIQVSPNLPPSKPNLPQNKGFAKENIEILQLNTSTPHATNMTSSMFYISNLGGQNTSSTPASRPTQSLEKTKRTHYQKK